MAWTRRTVGTTHGYTVEEVARFLHYDSEAVRYWLRTGHLVGQIDSRTGDWSVTAMELVSFLRQSVEPMPVGSAQQSRHSPPWTGASPAATRAAVPAPASSPPAVDGDRELAHAGRTAT
ncbi:MAG TPA: hypothetical protein VMM78_03915 [Thermomicrobiales bacterium]|nr:hypothetical protein [Thermomicrobiales bacterium]